MGIDQFEKFIIGKAENGDEILLSCDPEKCGDLNYLKPVFFKKEVLNRYYIYPNMYDIEEGKRVSCLDRWSIGYCQKDEKTICVFLGDLGNIPYEEQLYWKKYQ